MSYKSYKLQDSFFLMLVFYLLLYFTLGMCVGSECHAPAQSNLMSHKSIGTHRHIRDKLTLAHAHGLVHIELTPPALGDGGVAI